MTARERQNIRKLVTSMCANYDPEYECLPLDGTCYMFTIAFNTSRLCKYFKHAVLPLDPALEAVFTGQPVKPCQRCGKKFPVNRRQAYCSKACADIARLEATARRVQRHRNRNRQDVTL
ncbi:cysteine-rich VLP domain-containing protein [Eubacteriales bacterium OttesenSCG-928-K08]|nr:cysteine-rich VLP domain-containing protein [Eubacteriales bacterium OttesenSCG-928-K08]